MTADGEMQILLGRHDMNIEDALGRLHALPAWRPFDPRLIDFVARLSSRLLTSPHIREFPELAALGHWFRKARLVELARSHGADLLGSIRLGRGMAFHVAPANVDSVFMYSWLLSLLAGNTNIVRVSQKASPQQDVIIDILNDLCADERFGEVADRVILLTYPHNRALTQQISEACALRIVWGGDATVNEIRSIPLRSTAIELCFPDRFSLAAIRASELLEIDDLHLNNLVHGFYNDAFWFGQQACSSPRVITWVGSSGDIALAKTRFWAALADQVEQNKPDNSPSMLMTRLGAAFECAAEQNGDVSLSTRLADYPLVVDIDQAEFQSLRETHCGNGLFYQLSVETLANLSPHLTDKDQTLSVFGFRQEEIKEFVYSLPTRAIDRIMPIGKALDFDVVWDGQDFFSSMTRHVVIPP